MADNSSPGLNLLKPFAFATCHLPAASSVVAAATAAAKMHSADAGVDVMLSFSGLEPFPAALETWLCSLVIDSDSRIRSVGKLGAHGNE